MALVPPTLITSAGVNCAKRRGQSSTKHDEQNVQTYLFPKGGSTESTQLTPTTDADATPARQKTLALGGRGPGRKMKQTTPKATPSKSNFTLNSTPTLMLFFLNSCVREFGQGNKSKRLKDRLLLRATDGKVFVVTVREATAEELKNSTSADFTDPDLSTYGKKK
jgi:hypothetical protein